MKFRYNTEEINHEEKGAGGEGGRAAIFLLITLHTQRQRKPVKTLQQFLYFSSNLYNTFTEWGKGQEEELWQEDNLFFFHTHAY